jgi:hypothetical protein
VTFRPDESKQCEQCGLFRELIDLRNKQYRIDHDLLVGPASTIVGLAHLMPIAVREFEKNWRSIKKKLPPDVVKIIEENIDFSLILDASRHMIFTNQVLKEKLAEIMNKNVATEDEQENALE